MAKLIVEEGGKRRAFRMGNGVLTVGSGAEARLRLSSTQVAEIHLELELGEGGVKLRPRPGVVPPKIAGQSIQGELMLAPGKKVELGGARLWVEAEEGEGAALQPAAPGAARRRSPAGTEKRPARSERSRPERRPPGGVPGWVAALGVLGVAVLAFFLWFRNVANKADQGSGVAMNKLRAARQAAASGGDFENALRELSEIPPEAMTPEQALQKAELEQEFRERMSQSELGVANMGGTKYLETLLKKYEGLYLQGEPEKAKARLFLKRCRTFHERWPQHPELDWVRRQEARFAGYIDMNAPPTWEDVSWEVRDLTGGSPRNYVAALGMIDELLTRVAGEERTKAQNLRAELIAGRPEYATDRLYQAQYEFDKKQDPSKAVWWLVNNIAWLGDEALANESARFLVKMPDLAGHLLGYKGTYPERYEEVMRNPVVAAWADEAGFMQ